MQSEKNPPLSSYSSLPRSAVPPSRAQRENSSLESIAGEVTHCLTHRYIPGVSANMGKINVGGYVL